jgi:hypothetical protein
MKREDLHKLLGGYAAGTLTEEERRALLEAALADQGLFDALMREEPLRDTLADSRARRQILVALAAPPAVAWWRRPHTWALAGSLAAACVIAVVVVNIERKPQPPVIATLQKPGQYPHSPAVVDDGGAPAPEVQEMAKGRAAPAPAEKSARAFRAPASIPLKQEAPAATVPPPPAVDARPQETSRVASAAPASTLSPPVLAGQAGGSARQVAAAPVAAEPSVAPPPPAPAREVARTDANKLAEQQESAFRAKDRLAQAPAGFAVRTYDRAAKGEEARKEAQQTQDLELRYSLVRRAADGRMVEVPLDTLLPAGESPHLRLEANQAGYLYVIAAHGALFSGPVEPNRPEEVSVPAGTLHLILLRQPDQGPLSTLVARTRRQVANQRLNIQRGVTNYAVNSSQDADAAVLADVVVHIR